MKRGRTARMAAAVLAAAMLAAAGAHATEVRIEEDDILERLAGTQREQGRAQMTALIDERLAEAAEARASREGTAALESSAVSVVLAGRALQIWQEAEMSLREDGQATPPQVISAVVERAARLHAEASQLRQMADARGLARSAAGGSTGDVQNAVDSAAHVLLQAVVFTRDHAGDAERTSLLSMARSLGPAPATLPSFDRSVPDAAEYLNVDKTPHPPALRTPMRQKMRAVEEDDAQLRPMLQRFYEAMLSGDAAGARSLVQRGSSAAARIDAAVAAQQGNRLVSLGNIAVRKLAPGRFEAVLDQMKVADATGAESVRRDQIIVRRQDDGSYFVESLEPAQEQP